MFIGSPRSTASLGLVSWLAFPLGEWGLSPITELLVTTNIFSQLLHCYGCHALLAIATHRHHSWLGLLIECLL